MTRTNAREIVAQLTYEMSFREENALFIAQSHMEPEYFASLRDESDAYQENPGEKQTEYIKNTLCGIEEHREELDGYIAKYAIGWDISRISKPARAIMQLAMYESLFVDDVPTSAAINEAVELTRKYEDEQMVSFVNGILGSFAREVADK